MTLVQTYPTKLQNVEKVRHQLRETISAMTVL